MNLLGDIKDVLVASRKSVKTNNFFFEKHMCESKNEKIKVELLYTIRNNDSHDITNFGICPECKTIFYHEASSDQSL